MESLPNDVILLIGDYLEDRGDCYNAVLVNSRFHALFSRALFRFAILRNLTQLQLFLKAIVRQPSLASVIQCLDLSRWESAPAQRSLDSDELAQLSTWAQSFSHSNEEHVKWEQDLVNGNEEAWVALLLSLANNIRQLKLAYPRENKYLDRIFDRAVSSERQSAKFLRLEEVSLRHMEDDESKGSLSPAQILPFFRMPSMQTVDADTVIEPVVTTGASEREAEDAIGGESAQYSSVTNLTLSTSNAAQGLESLLSFCPSLKSLKYQHSDDHALASGFQPASFFTSLASSKPTLETLWLDSLGTHHAFTASGVNETYEGYFGSLADFAVLKDLRIRLPNLLDVGYTFEPSTPLPEILPTSIERLYVEACKENSLPMLISQLQLVLEARKEKFKALKRVDIEGFFHVDDEDLDDSGADGAAGIRERVIKERVLEMVQPLRDGCEGPRVQLYLRDRACAQTMVE